MSTESSRIALSLVSHTNAGKTTLARTLLGRDVGEVRDAAHVTEFAEAHTLVETPQGDALVLWDTPGFGDSVRLVRRLRQSAHPLGWFMSTVWDRWRDRPFWASQQAVRNVRDEADVMLYLVNAAEQPEAAGYVQPEMELLGWIGKPVIVLLNQLGPPREPAVEAAERARWQQHLAAHRWVVAVLPLDAFARCWVQEITLLRAIEAALSGERSGALSGESSGERRERMARLRAAWLAQRMATFDAAMQAIASSLARTATAAQAVPQAASFTQGLVERARHIGAKLGLGREGEAPLEHAQRALTEALADEVRDNTRTLIRLHGLKGDAQAEITARIATQFALRLRMDESRAALWGGAVTGALAGLKADIASGGLTLGGGLLAGGLLGALGAAGVARCVNLVRGTERSWLSWNAEALDQITEAALLRYLAVAHFGRGRGDWVAGESPPHWAADVQAALAPHRAALAAAWASHGAGAGANAADAGRAEANAADANAAGVIAADAIAAQRIAQVLLPVLTTATLAVLARSYPDSGVA